MSSVPATIAELPAIDYRSLLSDFRAAAWCDAHVAEPDDAVLMKNFHKIHEYFLRAIGRVRPGLFAGVDRALLIDVVRRWMAMYLRCIDEVRERFPRTEVSADLVADGKNWSARLGISYEGLDRLDVASRYAEYWAERSITWLTTRARGEGVLETFDARMAFIGSDYYVLHDKLKRAERLMIRDQAGNGITAFDIRACFAGLDEPDAFEVACEQREWILESLHQDARTALWRAARRA